MQTPPPFPNFKKNSVRKNNAGVALIIVLGMLALIVVLMVAFISSVSTELQSAKSYANGQDAKTLADSTVNIVISQIQDATANPQQAWASQPGMIRTYDNTGTAVTAYKLYSSDELRVTGAFNPKTSLAGEVPNTWATIPEQFTDLNKPVAVEGNNRYPIISPSAVAKNVSGNPTLVGSSPAIEGCYLDTSIAAAQVTADQSNPLPMPVRWMYVLKDGKIAPINRATGKVTGASSSNPIVGRVAFWTDDETCKVNVNTASEGTFWDRPWLATPAGTYETLLPTAMPVQNEFQRFPGHPAMTSLSVIFPPVASEVDALGEPTPAYKQRIYDIVPRIKAGGSNAGTTAITAVTGVANAIVPDTNRLFASVDEFLFQPALSTPRQKNLKDTTTSLTDDDIEKTRFFLTATSRAPEVNLFNKPRIALWPLQLDPDPNNPAIRTRNAKDKLIAFCSTIGNTPYYFQRYNTYISSQNIRAAGAAYNPSQNPRPSSQTPSMDWDLIPRNQQLFTYLQYLTGNPIPGLGGSLSGSSGKYNTATRNQILTEMFDLIRSGVNTVSNGGTPPYTYAPFRAGAWVSGEFQVVPLVIQPPGATGYKTKGFGQFPTVTQAAIVFLRTDNTLVDGVEQTNLVQVYPNVGHTVTPGPAPKMQAFLILQPFTPTPGPPPWSANVRYSVEGLNTWTVNGVNMGFPATATNLLTCLDGECHATALTGLELCTQWYGLKIKSLGIATVGASDEEEKYPFFSSVIPFNTADTTFVFGGGPITVKIYPGYATSLDAADLVQTIHMDFPTATLPVPLSPVSTSTVTLPSPQTTVTQFNTIDTHFGSLETGGGYGVQRNGQHNPLPLVRPQDTVRAVEARYAGPAKGDYRLIAGLFDVPDTYFEGHGMKDSASDGKKYTDSLIASRLMHSLRVDADSGSNPTGNGVNGFYSGSGAPHGKLLAAANYYTGSGAKGNREPVAPRGLVEATMFNGSRGDWDTGIGRQRDGAYTNKPDLGNVGSAAAVTNGYYNALGFDRSASTTVVSENGSTFSPNRQIASAVSFGSLPTGIDPGNPANAKPWQTLLFCKNPLGGASHNGFGTPAAGPPYTIPPDHAFLDFFTMPIVEPYAISEPFSTAGKVNMNYQIVPFTYLTRSTGVRAVLKSTKMMAIPTSLAPIYKENQNTPTAAQCRYTLNMSEQTGTLAGFEQRFNAGDIFRSASEICDLYLVPKQNVDGNLTTATYATMSSWWSPTYDLTGDNLREIPYAHIYPRLTTKSNTFTVHVQTQSLKKLPGSAPDVFLEGKDQVTGEFRGSFIIERYLDPGSDSLVTSDGSAPSDTNPNAMVGPYKFRILSSKRFAP